MVFDSGNEFEGGRFRCELNTNFATASLGSATELRWFLVTHGQWSMASFIEPPMGASQREVKTWPDF